MPISSPTNIYTLDTETSCDQTHAWVWSWALCDSELRTVDGNGLDLVRGICDLPDGAEVYVHNLTFDGEYIYYDLLAHGFLARYDQDERRRYHAEFWMREDLQGIIRIVVWWHGKRITLRDSLRIFRCKLEELPKLCGFDAEETKGEMDYTEVRLPDHVKTPEERDYQLRDVRVLMRAIQWLRAQQPRGNTIGAIAVLEYKETWPKSPFKPLRLDERTCLSSLYSGGVVAVRADHVQHVHGRVYDRNSMYPSEGRFNDLPYAIDMWGGTPVDDWTCAVHVLAEGLVRKPHRFGTIIMPFGGGVRDRIDGLDKWLFMPEWNAIREDYDIRSWEIINVIRFKCTHIMDDFVDKWIAVKALRDSRRNYAKFVLNNLTGKLAENPQHEEIRRRPVGNSYIQYRHNDNDVQLSSWQFMPATAQITSRSRLALRDAAIRSGIDNLYYTDTDSIHTCGELPADMLDPNALGKWDLETEFDRALYIKPKSYVEMAGSKTVSCKHAGINNNATLAICDASGRPIRDSGILISGDNMRPGAYYYTNAHRKICGGVIIERKVKVL